jgi:hypothetical protein
LIDGQLYLPRDWARDKHRRSDAGIPEERHGLLLRRAAMASQSSRFRGFDIHL